jgi:hypothetical protein
MATNSIDGNAIPLSGDSGLIMKNWLVALFSGAIQSNVLNLHVLLATTAANCGIGSTFFLFGSSLWIDLLQDIGRVCCGSYKWGDLQDQYHLYLNCNLFLALLFQIKQEHVPKEHHIQMKDLMDVLWFIFVPTRCYHITLEENFEEPNAAKI